MLFMNEYEIQDAYNRCGSHPVLASATETLRNLMDWTNQNSDGWAYWPKPCRAAKNLQELIGRYEKRQDVTVAEYRKALVPIKSFRTRQGASFEIVEV